MTDEQLAEGRKRYAGNMRDCEEWWCWIDEHAEELFAAAEREQRAVTLLQNVLNKPGCAGSLEMEIRYFLQDCGITVKEQGGSNESHR